MGFYLLSYLCIFVFLLAAAHLIYRQIALPVHVRWELYPVQHETAGRAAYGGSYMEEIDWWKKKPRSSLWNELRYMVPEILFLRGLWKENRALWLVSFPFHFGLYLMIATFSLLLIHAALAILGGHGSFFAEGSTGRSLLDGLIISIGWIGLILGNIGCAGVFHRRLTDPALRNYSSFVDYFNILFIFVFFLSALLTCLMGGPFFEGAKAYTMGLLTGGHAPNAYVPGQSVFGGLAIVSASLLVAYIPLTHMSHMFMKFFLYHAVKWDDAPNLRGSRIEAAIRENLELKPTWMAEHVEADGRKSWRDIASSAPKETK